MQKKKRFQISNKIKLSNTVRITLVLFAVVVFAIGSGNLIKSLFFKTQVVTESNDIYKYNNSFSENVNINLKDNAFVAEDEIIEGQTYLSDLISTIIFNMHYKYTDSKPTEVRYSYKIEATIKSIYTNSKNSYEVLNKTETLKQKDEKIVKSTDLVIDEKIKVDYSKYHQIIKKFKQEMGINADSYLYIKIIVNTKATINSKEVENEYSSDYRVTLGDKIALVEENSKTETSDSIIDKSEYKQKANLNVKEVIANVIVILAGLILLRIILVKTEKLNTIKNEYKLELNRILKSCESKLVQIEDLKQIDVEHATRVKDIYQLLKLSDEALVPIYCYIKEETEEEAYFIVTKYEKSYIFILKNKKGM